MPTSTHFMLHNMVYEIMDAKPDSMLDVGIGFGKWGFLAREYIDVKRNEIYPEQWTLKIDGIEIWAEYVERLPWLRTIYNRIYIGDANKVIDDLPDYDLIVLADVIEHMPKKDGEELLIKCFRKCKKNLILSLPIGDWTGNRILANNPYESHISVWNQDEIFGMAEKEGVKIKKNFTEWQRSRKRAAACVVSFRK